MALWRGLVETKAASPADSAAATSRALAGGNRAGSFGYTYSPPDNVEQVVNGHYARCLWVFKCVDAIAMAESSIPIYAWQSHDDDAARSDGYDTLERLLNGPDRVNKYEEAWQFRYRLSSLLLLSQVGVFVEIVPDADTDDPAELHILDSDAVRIERDPRDYVKAYWITYLHRDEQGRTSNRERHLDPERVLFLRARPHPKDQYRQVTPLQAAGLSADTDFLARMFNATWLKNDGRPSQLIAVGDGEGGSGMSPEDADTVRGMFSGGVNRAGETRVVEANRLSVAQVSGSPADAQYSDLLSGSRQDILMAFGVSESFLAWAAGRTWDNSGVEIVTTWRITMKPHCKAVASGFMPLARGMARSADSGTVLAHDFMRVPELQEAQRAKAEQALKLQAAGDMTIDESREAAGLEPWNVAATRVLWTANGPIGRDDADQKAALELMQSARPPQPTFPGLPPGQAPPGAQGGAGGAQGGPAALGGTKPGQPALPPGAASQDDLQALAGQLRSAVSQRAADEVRQSTPGRRSALTGAKARLSRSPERKTAARTPRTPRRKTRPAADDDVIDAEVVDEQWHDDPPDETLTKTLAVDVTREISGVCRRMLGAVDGRLQSVKTRERTRHWTPTEAEVKAGWSPTRSIVETYVVQNQRWTDQLSTDLRFMIRSGASMAMADLRPTLELDPAQIELASRRVREMANRLADDLSDGLDKRARRIQRLIRRMDDEGRDLQEIKDAVADEQARLDRWAQQVGPRVARAAVQGARKLMIDRVPDSQGVSVWKSMDDARVRPTHVAADGQVAARGKAFVIGGARMMFPGDPRGPAREWAGCRCRVAYRRALDGAES